MRSWKKPKMGLAVLSVVLLAGAVGALSINSNAVDELKMPSELTAEELRALYKKYNISENDIKFALGKLPHYLEGTPLDGPFISMGRILPNGTIVDWEDPVVAARFKEMGVKVVPASKFFAIEERARKEYIRKYGVDPANPKVILVDGVPVPREYVEKLGRRLVKEGKIAPEFDSAQAAR